MSFNNPQNKSQRDLSHPTTNTRSPERSHTSMRSPRVKFLLKFRLSGHKSSLLYRFQPSSPHLNIRPNSAHKLLNQTLLLSLSHLLSPRGRAQSRSLFPFKCDWTTSNLTRPSRSSWRGTTLSYSNLNNRNYATNTPHRLVPLRRSSGKEEKPGRTWTPLQGNRTSLMTTYITRMGFPSRLSSLLLWQFSLQHIFSFEYYNYGLYMHFGLLFFIANIYSTALLKSCIFFFLL